MIRFPQWLLDAWRWVVPDTPRGPVRRPEMTDAYVNDRLADILCLHRFEMNDPLLPSMTLDEATREETLAYLRSEQDDLKAELADAIRQHGAVRHIREQIKMLTNEMLALENSQ